MNKKLTLAKDNSMKVSIASAIIFFVLFFPLKINCYSFIDVKKRILTFGIYLYFIKVLSGFGGLYAGDLYINIARKNFKTPLVQVIKSKTGVIALKYLSINKVDLLFEYGSTSNANSIYLWAFFNVFGDVFDVLFKNVLKTNFNSCYILSTESDVNNLYSKSVVVSNLFLMLLLMIKIIISKVKNEQSI